MERRLQEASCQPHCRYPTSFAINVIGVPARCWRATRPAVAKTPTSSFHAFPIQFDIIDCEHEVFHEQSRYPSASRYSNTRKQARWIQMHRGRRPGQDECMVCSITVTLRDPNRTRTTPCRIVTGTHDPPEHVRPKTCRMTLQQSVQVETGVCVWWNLGGTNWNWWRKSSGRRWKCVWPSWTKSYHFVGQTTMDSRLRDITAVPPRAHTVNDLLTMYVGTASQHALRMTFVHESKGKNICLLSTFPFFTCGSWHGV